MACACFSRIMDYDNKDSNVSSRTEETLRVQTKVMDFSLEGEIHTARVVDVHDGDTVRVVFRRRGELVQYRVRMLGYDSAEISGRNRTEPEKRAAILARDALRCMVQKDRQLIRIECKKFDAFGRLLGTLFLEDGLDVNAWMIEQKYGVVYTGGKKMPFQAALFRCD